MKLKNIIKIGSFIVAGTLPTTSQAQVYECKQCPAGTYSGGGTATSCTPCPAGKYSNPRATSCSTCSAVPHVPADNIPPPEQAVAVHVLVGNTLKMEIALM